MYSNISSVNKYNKYINSYFNIPNIYMLTSTHSLEDHEYVTKLDRQRDDGSLYPFDLQLFQQADKIGIKNFSITRHGIYVPYSVAINEVKNNESYNNVLPMHELRKEYPNVAIFLNDLFGENIKFPLKEGRNFRSQDFEESEYLSVIVGSKYSNKFKIGDKLNIKLQKYYTETEEKVVTVKIIGFLEEDTEVMASVVSPEIIDANNIIIVGLSNEYKTDAGFFSYFQETINGVVETTKPKEVENKILELARTMGYAGKGGLVTLYDMKEAYQDDIRFNDRSFSSYYLILGISIFVSLIITILANYLVIRKNKYDYGVLLINGATKNKIRNRILLENLIILLIADVIGIILTLKYIGMISPLVFIGYNLVMLVIVLITSSLILKNKKTIEFINFNEQNN